MLTVAEREAAAVGSGEEEGMDIDLEQWRSAKSATGYRGVNMFKDRYQARILVSGEMRYLGTYDTVEEAARAYARKYLEIHGEPPEMSLPVAEPEAKRARRHPDIRRKVSGPSRNRPQGIFAKNGRYKAEITLPSGESKCLGIYDTANEAARAFGTKYLELYRGLNDDV